MLAILNFLMTQYTLPTIIIGIVLCIIFFTEIVKFIAWCKKAIIKPIQQKALAKQRYEERLQRVEALTTTLLNKNTEQDATIKTLQGLIQLLIDSDKDAIKAWITRCHHELIKQGWVDDYMLECIEARFGHYQQENGNSFVEDLMKEIRALPHFPPNEQEK